MKAVWCTQCMRFLFFVRNKSHNNSSFLYDLTSFGNRSNDKSPSAQWWLFSYSSREMASVRARYALRRRLRYTPPRIGLQIRNSTLWNADARRAHTRCRAAYTFRFGYLPAATTTNPDNVRVTLSPSRPIDNTRPSPVGCARNALLECLNATCIYRNTGFRRFCSNRML